MGAKDAIGIHAVCKLASRHALPLNGGANVFLKIVVGVNSGGGHMLSSIAREARDGTGRRETLIRCGISFAFLSFAHSMRRAMRSLNQ